MLLLLFPEALFEHSEHLLDRLFLIALRHEEGAQLVDRLRRLVEPVKQLLRQFLLKGDALEILQKQSVKLVVIRLCLDKHCAAEIIKAGERCMVQIQQQPLQQRHPLAQRHAKAARTQQIKKSDKHRFISSFCAASRQDPCLF